MPSYYTMEKVGKYVLALKYLLYILPIYLLSGTSIINLAQQQFFNIDDNRYG